MPTMQSLTDPHRRDCGRQRAPGLGTMSRVRPAPHGERTGHPTLTPTYRTQLSLQCRPGIGKATRKISIGHNNHKVVSLAAPCAAFFFCGREVRMPHSILHRRLTLRMRHCYGRNLESIDAFVEPTRYRATRVPQWQEGKDRSPRYRRRFSRTAACSHLGVCYWYSRRDV